VVLVLVLAAGAAGYILWRITHTEPVNQETANSTGNPSASATVSTDSTGKFTPEELGADLYPGAQPGKVGNTRVSTPSGSVVSASYLTSDSKERVVSFYRAKLGGQASMTDMGPSATFTLKKSVHEQVTVTIAQDAGQAGGKTQIRIMHMTDNQAR